MNKYENKNENYYFYSYFFCMYNSHIFYNIKKQQSRSTIKIWIKRKWSNTNTNKIKRVILPLSTHSFHGGIFIVFRTFCHILLTTSFLFCCLCQFKWYLNGIIMYIFCQIYRLLVYVKLMAWYLMLQITIII